MWVILVLKLVGIFLLSSFIEWGCLRFGRVGVDMLCCRVGFLCRRDILGDWVVFIVLGVNEFIFMFFILFWLDKILFFGNVGDEGVIVIFLNVE